MKPRTQIILAGALLMVVLAWSSARRGARSGDSVPSGGACCPFLPALDGRLPPSVTNGTKLDCPPQSPGATPETSALAVTNAPGRQVIAYYFHGAVRCETCVKIEQRAREIIGQQFQLELKASRLVFQPVDYDLPEHAHFRRDYQLPCPSLVLVRQQDGADENWTLLGDTWQLVEDPVKFNGYVATEVRKCLRGEGGFANSKTNPLPAAAPNRR
jgi:hypothetical protein